MKKLFDEILLLVVVCGLWSCRNDIDYMEDGNHRGLQKEEKPIKKTVRMSFGGDYISESEEPMMRAEDGTTFVGINVWRTEKDKENAQEERYAYGVFEGKEDISIDVVTGYTYRFQASILIEWEDRVTLDGKREFREPFMTHDGTSTGFATAGSFVPGNVGAFIYTDGISDIKQRRYLSQLKSGTAYVKVGGELPSGAPDERSMLYPSVKRFYGEKDSYDPSLMTDVEIQMDYKSFGIRFNLVSIPEGTSLKVSDVTPNGNKLPSTDPEYFLHFKKGLDLSLVSEASRTWEGIYSMNSFDAPTKELTLQFSWNKGGGKYESFTHKFTVQEKRMKVLDINIDGDPNSTKSGNITFSMSDDMEIETPETVTKDFRKK